MTTDARNGADLATASNRSAPVDERETALARLSPSEESAELVRRLCWDVDFGIRLAARALWVSPRVSSLKDARDDAHSQLDWATRRDVVELCEFRLDDYPEERAAALRILWALAVLDPTAPIRKAAFDATCRTLQLSTQMPPDAVARRLATAGVPVPSAVSLAWKERGEAWLESLDCSSESQPFLWDKLSPVQAGAVLCARLDASASLPAGWIAWSCRWAVCLYASRRPPGVSLVEANILALDGIREVLSHGEWADQVEVALDALRATLLASPGAPNGAEIGRLVHSRLA